jgi:hypothetical protein
LLSLFPEADYLASLRDDLGGWWGTPAPDEPTMLRRARLKTAVLPLREVLRRPEAPEAERAVASLLIALVDGDEQVDSVSTELLSRVANTYPQQKLTAFISRYYLYVALEHRQKHEEALAVARQAVNAQGADDATRTLRAYEDLCRVAQSPVQDPEAAESRQGD